MDPRQRLKVLNQSSPSIRLATAPSQPLRVSVAQQQPLFVNTGKQTYRVNQDPTARAGVPDPTTPSPQTVNRSPINTGLDFLGHVGNAFDDIAKPIARIPANLTLNASNLILHNVLGHPVITAPQAAQQSPSLRPGINAAGATGSGRQLGGDLAVAGSYLIPGLAETKGAGLLTKSAIDAGAGGLFGAGSTASDNPNATVGDYFKNIASNAAIAGGTRLGLAGLGKIASKVKPNGSTVGLDKTTLNFIKNSDSPEDIHALLSSIYGGTSEALQNASVNLAKNGSSRAIVKELENLPLQSAAATGISALASDAVAKNKYGESPLTGKGAPRSVEVPKDVRPLGPQDVPGQQGIPLDNTSAFESAQVEAQKAAGVADDKIRASAANHNARDLVKQGGTVGKAVTRGMDSSTSDPLNTVINSLAKSPNKDEVRQLVEGLKLPVEGNEKNVLIKELTKTTNPDEVKTKIADSIDKFYAQEDSAAIEAAGGVPTPKELSSATPDQGGSQSAEIAPNGASVIKTTPPSAESTQVAENVNKTADKAVSAVPNTEGPSTPKDELLGKLDEASTSYHSDAKVYSKQLGQKFAKGTAAYDNAGGGLEGYKAKLGSMKGKKQSGFQPLELSEDSIHGLLDEVQATKLSPAEKLNAQHAVLKVTGHAEGAPTPSDIKYIRNALGNDIADAVQQNVELAGKTKGEIAAMIASTPKAAMATGDLSAPLRQGAVLGTRYPKEFAAASKDMVKYFGSQKNFDEGMKAIREDPLYELSQKAGLATDGAGGIVGTEEQFMSSLLESDALKKVGYGHLVAGSDRAYTGFLTKLRFDAFKSIINDTNKAGVELDEKALKSLGKFINTASGRGDLGSLERHAGLLSKALFSPRLWKSRLDLLNPVYYAKLSGPARKLALQSSASFASVAGTILGLSAAAGATVVWDPRSADFAKIKIGNTRYDILGGLQQNIRLGAQLITGQKINSATGEIQTLGDGITTPTRKDLLYSFFQNKENPLIGYATKILSEKKDSAGNTTDEFGQPVNNLTEAAKLLIPLNASGAYETVKDTGSIAKGVGMNLPGIFGVGVQTYGNIASKDQGKDASGKVTYKGKITPDMVTDSSGKAILDKNGKPVTVTIPDGASKLEIEALKDAKRTSALKTQYKDTLSGEDKALVGLSAAKLAEYKSSGKISGDKYNSILQAQQHIDNIGGIKIPDGVKSEPAKAFYTKYNGLTPDQQTKFLARGKPDANSEIITKELNKTRVDGLPKLKASNALAKEYSDYEHDINSHPEYTDVDKQNKAKTFQKTAYSYNYPESQRKLYTEGSSADLKALIGDGKITKSDLGGAMKLDEDLFKSGLAGRLKFSKKFREAYGYTVPSTKSGSGSGRGGSSSKKNPVTEFNLADAFLPSASASHTNAVAPKFSSVSRGIKFKAPTTGMIRGANNAKKISIKL